MITQVAVPALARVMTLWDVPCAEIPVQPALTDDEVAGRGQRACLAVEAS